MSHKKKQKKVIKKQITEAPVQVDSVIKVVSKPLVVPELTPLFKNHLLEVKNSESKIHYTKYDFLVAGILFISFALFVRLYVKNRKRLSQVIKSFYLNTSQFSREGLSLGNGVSVFLSVLSVFTLSIFIGQLINYYGFSITTGNFNYFVVTSLLIILGYSLKLISIKILGYIFQTPKPASEYIITIFLFVNTLGLFMFPIVVCLAFAKQINPLIFIYSGDVIILYFLLMRFIRGFIIGLNTLRASKFYLFMYLCTLEIFPIVIMVKIIMLEIK